ncbi:hypothetical protein BHE74_00039724, partial [Ensete ventricosum]
SYSCSGDQRVVQRQRRRAATVAESSDSGERQAASDGNRVSGVIAIHEWD